ncbi:NAD(P)-dependent dehydrogenase (short-subunit alcohol dehydrogenase family) [Kineococcus radiotolerans]|uniref:NAD(P)-dependent dehydrogenase (Short-subunit alcohol dehydrogenase family) n=1 Tax=Kineococcus radiotolerans TaxID=131568 RepID=A0A7W4TJ47_KINRA|nr:D-threitol dehydrogenase [Kineococcus radiotolerans]MBB2899855.1 NAD(P)-dependent dehydrogenase (short-subunit alcohol dehydrogenase family) [Kineococcus radiotolerans]
MTPPRVALVTGGAGGIGAAVVAALEAEGTRVAVLDRTETSLGELQVGADTTDPAQVRAAVDEVVARAGRLDVLVNCAGVATIAPALEIDLAGWERTVAVNLTGAFVVAQAVARHLAAHGGGRIVTIASQAATVGLAGHVAYAASKAGLLGMTRTLALEWGPLGITVNTVSPTVVLTPLARPNWENPAGEALRAQIPVGRFAEPEEVAAAVVFLTGPGGAMVNGHDLVVDGGYTVR